MLELVLNCFEKEIPFMLVNSRITDRESSAENVANYLHCLFIIHIEIILSNYKASESFMIDNKGLYQYVIR